LPRFLTKAAEQFALLDEDQKKAHQIIIQWADQESSGKLKKMNESHLQGVFISEIFGNVLGYSPFGKNPDSWEIQEHYSLPRGQNADAAIGFFGKENGQPPVAIIELKGPTANLDRRSGGRSSVLQCWDYLNDLPGCPWGIVCNYVSFRLYHRNYTTQNYELFTLQELRNKDRFAEFLVLFARDGLLRPVLGAEPRALRLLAASSDRQKEVGKQLYKQYHEQRGELVAHLRKPPFNKSLDAAISIAQTLLDRVIFIAFCQHRDLLPWKTLQSAWTVTGFRTVTNPKWRNFLDLFKSMDQGNDNAEIPRFNGGLFAHNPEVDDLELEDRWTGFFKNIGEYDFGAEVSVDVLGHIFEQSITDLEVMRRNPESLEPPEENVLGQRKREGVYYTPPRITEYIVQNTLGPCIADRFAQIAQRHQVDPQAGPTDANLPAWIESRNEMLDSLRKLRVCDMACGSGAFLVRAFNYLEDVYADLIASLGEHVKLDEAGLLDEARRAILTENLFGVDLSSEAVEIARLSLWIRSARKGKTLVDLAGNIQCGNSIVDDPDADPKALDWRAKFPRVFDEGGFDCIIGNPPYVKLQNFRKTSPKVAAYLVQRYRSAKTGSFDLYLPFIERGLELLNPTGRLGFIAPNVWLFNIYGQGLRDLVLEKRAMEKFVDFKSFQVFEDATTYTALQFFSHRPQKAVETIDASAGDPNANPSFPVSYDGLSNGAWALLPGKAQGILDRLRKNAVTLEEASSGIIVGVQTSADSVYHLTKLGPGKYYSDALKEIVELDDDLLKPLVSGKEAVPFACPSTDTFIIFPYEGATENFRLLNAKEMSKYRRTWAYLRKNGKTLRARERGLFDDDEWYRYGRSQSIGKQTFAKLLVPRLQLNLFASADARGELFMDNVDVGGVIPGEGWDIYYLLGILNSNACNFAWRMTSKPFRGGYRSANKQFIAPLPIPNVKGKKQEPVAQIARKLADLHGERLAALGKVHRRIAVDLAPAALVQASPLPPALPRKLESFAELSIAEALQEAEKFAKRKFTPAQREQWDAYLTAETDAIAKVHRSIADLTAELNQKVYDLYKLGEEDIKVIQAACADR